MTTRNVLGVRIATTDEQIARAERLAETTSTVDQLPIDENDRGGWRIHAECRKVDPEIFHPISDQDLDTIAAALKVCDRCPVLAACNALRYDIGATGTVMAGTYYTRNARGKRPCALQGCHVPTSAVNTRYCSFEHEHSIKVGTMQGYNLHARHKVKICPRCHEAKARDSIARNLGAGGTTRRTVTHSGSRVASA